MPTGFFSSILIGFWFARIQLHGMELESHIGSMGFLGHWAFQLQ